MFLPLPLKPVPQNRSRVSSINGRLPVASKACHAASLPPNFSKRMERIKPTRLRSHASGEQKSGVFAPSAFASHAEGHARI